MQLILASSSEGRKKLLSLLKIPFEVISSEIDEEKIIGKTPLETLKLRAKLKCEDVVKQLSNYPINTNKYQLSNKKLITNHQQLTTYLILSADSGGIVGNQLIGKPKDYDDAVRILTLLSGKTHQFVTAVYMLRSHLHSSLPYQPKTESGFKIYKTYEVSYVTFKKLSQKDIKRYLSLTKYTKFAGGYTLFASPQDFITKIEGSLSNVVGLPLEKVILILKENGLLPIIPIRYRKEATIR